MSGLFDDLAPITERCPACWGAKGTSGVIPYEVARWRTACPVCDGEGRCAPVPVKGRLGVWEWTAPVQGDDRDS